MTRIAIVTCYNSKGELLLGLRRDSKRWTLAGGHLNEGEAPINGARRELKEETNLDGLSLSFLTEETTPDGAPLYVFSAYAVGIPTGKRDPDQEVKTWTWVDVSNGLPSKYYDKLQPPAESGFNILTRIFDRAPDKEVLEKRERIYSLDEVAFANNNFGGDSSARDLITMHAGTENLLFRLVDHPIDQVQTMGTIPEKLDPVRQAIAVGAKLPPVVLGHDNVALDGNHTVAALAEAGHKTVPAFQLIKSEKHVDPNDPLLRRTPTGQVCQHGLHVFMINGEHLRNHVDSDVVQGLNPERYPWMPKGEIWVDDDTPPEEVPYVVLHECIEAHLMSSKGEGYEQAHDEAKRVEDGHRHQDEPGEMQKSLPKTEKCSRCSKQATTRVLWAEAMGYKPACDDHIAYWKKFFEDKDDFSGLRPIKKHEVETLLKHPNPAERRMALRLSSVAPDHLHAGALDPEPSVHQLAIDHPFFGDVEGLRLLNTNSTSDGTYPLTQQLHFLSQPERVKPFHISAAARSAYSHSPEVRAAMLDVLVNHPTLDSDGVRELYNGYGAEHRHRHALLQNQSAPSDVVAHGLGLGSHSPSPEAVELACTAAQHPNLPAEAAADFVSAAARDRQAPVTTVAAAVLAHQPIPASFIQDLLARYAAGADPHRDQLVHAFLLGPSATQEHVNTVLRVGRPQARASVLSSPQATPQHLDAVQAAAKATKDKDTLQRVIDHKHFGPAQLAQLVAQS